MARSWTRLHEYLGHPPGPVTYEMVAEAVQRKLGESDDLDWKEALPPVSPVPGQWNEFAKDVAAMTNTRGGLLVYGVSDTVDMVGIDLDKVNDKQLGQLPGVLRPAWKALQAHATVRSITGPGALEPPREDSRASSPRGRVVGNLGGPQVDRRPSAPRHPAMTVTTIEPRHTAVDAAREPGQRQEVALLIAYEPASRPPETAPTDDHAAVWLPEGFLTAT